MCTRGVAYIPGELAMRISQHCPVTYVARIHVGMHVRECEPVVLRIVHNICRDNTDIIAMCVARVIERVERRCIGGCVFQCWVWV